MSNFAMTPPSRRMTLPAHGKMTVLLGLLSCLCFLRAPLAAESKPAPANLSAAQIVEKHVAARGNPHALRALPTLSVTGKMDAVGGDSPLRSDRIAPLGTRATIKHAPAGATA